VVESRPIDRHRTDRQQADRSSLRAPGRPQTTDRHLDAGAGAGAGAGARIIASNRRWEQSYGGARSDSHRWLRFR
jgi:hypothetical protein